MSFDMYHNIQPILRC